MFAHPILTGLTPLDGFLTIQLRAACTNVLMPRRSTPTVTSKDKEYIWRKLIVRKFTYADK